MKKRGISALLLAGALMLTPVQAMAEEQKPEYISVDETNTASSGKCGENVTWTLDNQGTLTIQGEGSMNDYGLESDESAEPAPWKNVGAIKSIVIKDGVTYIGNYAFMDSDAEQLNIASTVEHIGEGVFANCEKLDTVNFEKDSKLKYIGNDAFGDCKQLKTIIIPKNMEELNVNVFGGCSSLEKVEFEKDSKMNTFAMGAFSGCTSLKEIIMPKGMKEIGVYAFSGCKSLKNVTIPKNVKYIFGEAFKGCTSLKTVKIESGSKLELIDNNVWKDCKSLNTVYIGSRNLKDVEKDIFKGCGAVKVKVPASKYEYYKKLFKGKLGKAKLTKI